MSDVEIHFMVDTLPVNEGNDDVFHVHLRVQISTSTQEVAQRLQVVVVWENLKRKRQVFN